MSSKCRHRGSYGCLETLKVPEFCVGVIKHFEVLDLSTVLESASYLFRAGIFVKIVITLLCIELS